MLQAIVCGILVVRASSFCARLAMTRSEQFVRSDDDRADDVAVGSGPTNMTHHR